MSLLGEVDGSLVYRFAWSSGESEVVMVRHDGVNRWVVDRRYADPWGANFSYYYRGPGHSHDGKLILTKNNRTSIVAFGPDTLQLKYVTLGDFQLQGEPFPTASVTARYVFHEGAWLFTMIQFNSETRVGDRVYSGYYLGVASVENPEAEIVLHALPAEYTGTFLEIAGIQLDGTAPTGTLALRHHPGIYRVFRLDQTGPHHELTLDDGLTGSFGLTGTNAFLRKRGDLHDYWERYIREGNAWRLDSTIQDMGMPYRWDDAQLVTIDSGFPDTEWWTLHLRENGDWSPMRSYSLGPSNDSYEADGWVHLGLPGQGLVSFELETLSPLASPWYPELPGWESMQWLGPLGWLSFVPTSSADFVWATRPGLQWMQIRGRDPSDPVAWDPTMGWIRLYPETWDRGSASGWAWHFAEGEFVRLQDGTLPSPTYRIPSSRRTYHRVQAPTFLDPAQLQADELSVGEGFFWQENRKCLLREPFEVDGQTFALEAHGDWRYFRDETHPSVGNLVVTFATMAVTRYGIPIATFTPDELWRDEATEFPEVLAIELHFATAEAGTAEVHVDLNSGRRESWPAFPFE